MSSKVRHTLQSKRSVSLTARAPLGALVSASLLVLTGGCTTTQVTALPPIPPPPPGYVLVPHPEGTDLGDLVAVFTDKAAPSPEQLKECDADFKKLRSQTTSPEEISQGAREFVRQDPIKYHWCFYGLILHMEEALDHDLYVDQRQKAVVETFLFATPIAKAFLAEYNDSRYMRWAITRYRRLSEFVFFRKLEQSTQMTSELVTASNPFALQRQPRSGYEGVLHKYGLLNNDPAKGAPIGTVAALPGPEASGVPPVTPERNSPTEVAQSSDSSSDLAPPDMPESNRVPASLEPPEAE